MLVVIPPSGYTFNTSLSSTHANMAVIGNFIIYDKARRGNGWGRCIYTEWESSLPVFIKTIYLRAKSPEAEKFWVKMGFARLYDDPDLNIFENGGVPMIKHIHPPNQAATAT